MAFESLAHQHSVAIIDFPAEWLPLCFLYDPDLPLFPLLYFHALDPELPPGQRPAARDRIYGFVHHINLEGAGAVAGVVLNKDLSLTQNSKYVPVVERLVRERLGLGSPITPSEIQRCLSGSLQQANPVLLEIWHQVVAPAFGNKLPFGEVWDPTFGLIRFIASWNSDGGRKGELIQTHYFCSAFGERIAAANPVNVDFYLLPTFEEFQDPTNPLSLFPKVAALAQAASRFVNSYCASRNVGSHSFSAFSMSRAGLEGQLNTPKILELVGRETGSRRTALFECYSAFNRGPGRTIIALMMLDDLRNCRWHPRHLTPAECGEMYTALRSSYQSSKVIQLYVQQCFGQEAALPLDIWVKTFLKWPIGFDYRDTPPKLAELFATSSKWGKIERLIWMAVQARKVHSSVAAEILWCIRYGDPEGTMRGSNPLSCKICLPAVRNACPAHAAIRDLPVYFNKDPVLAGFQVDTSAQDDVSPNQHFVACFGSGKRDEYSARDRPDEFRPFPQQGAYDGISVSDFIDTF